MRNLEQQLNANGSTLDYVETGENRITAHSVAREIAADFQTIREQCEREHEARRVAIETYKRDAFARPQSN